MNVRPRSSTRARACAAASSTVSPRSTTSAPSLRVLSIFTNGVGSGITITARMPRRRAWYATPWAWLPADMATTPAARSLGRELGQPVESAPLLEGRRVLEVLELEPELGAGDLRKRPGEEEGRALDLALQALGRGPDVGELDQAPAPGAQGKRARCPRPSRSSIPSIAFMFWIACPEAPLTRLSVTLTMIAWPGTRLGWTPMRQRLVPRT